MDSKTFHHLITDAISVQELQEKVTCVSSSPKPIKTYGSTDSKKSFIENQHTFKNNYCDDVKMKMESIIESEHLHPNVCSVEEEAQYEYEYEYEDCYDTGAYHQYQHHYSSPYSRNREEPELEREEEVEMIESKENEVVSSLADFPSLERSSPYPIPVASSSWSYRDPWNNNTSAEMEWMETAPLQSLSDSLNPFPSAFCSNFCPLFSSLVSSSPLPPPPPPPPRPSPLIDCLLSLPVSVIMKYLSSCLMEEANNGTLDDKEWKSLVNTTKNLLSLRKESIYLSLNYHYSVQYYLNPLMRKKILKRVSDPSQQIALKLDERVWIPRDIEETETTEDERSIDSYEGKKKEANNKHERKESQNNKWNHPYLTRINNIHVLNLSKNLGLTNISFLTTIGKSLNLSHCHDLEDISAFSIILENMKNNQDSNNQTSGERGSGQNEDINKKREDGKWESIDKKETIRDHCLMINLSYCPKIIDFSSLSLVNSSPIITSLSLHHNPQLLDVSPFQHIQYLNISFCSSLTNVAPLWKNYSIKASNCEKVQNWSILTHVIHLNLSNNKNLYFLPTICSQTETLNLDYCKGLESISELTETFLLPTDFSSKPSYTSSSLTAATSSNVSSFSSTLSSFISSLSSMETEDEEKEEDGGGDDDDGMYDSALSEISLVGCHNLTDISCLKFFPSLSSITICPCMRRLTAPLIEARKKAKRNENQEKRGFHGKIDFKQCSSACPSAGKKRNSTLFKPFEKNSVPSSHIYYPDYKSTRKEMGNKKRDSDEGENGDSYDDDSERKKAKSPRKDDSFNDDDSMRKYKTFRSNSSSTSSLPALSSMDFPITIKKEDFPYLSPTPSPPDHQMTPRAMTMNHFRPHRLPTVFNDTQNLMMNRRINMQDYDDEEVKRLLEMQQTESFWYSIN
jgi:hypothetical protein